MHVLKKKIIEKLLPSRYQHLLVKLLVLCSSKKKRAKNVAHTPSSVQGKHIRLLSRGPF